MTYARLMRQTEEVLTALCPGKIILDEFHRCGTEQWGSGVAPLLAKPRGMGI